MCRLRAYPEHLVDAWMEGHTQFQPLYEKKKKTLTLILITI